MEADYDCQIKESLSEKIIDGEIKLEMRQGEGGSVTTMMIKITMTTITIMMMIKTTMMAINIIMMTSRVVILRPIVMEPGYGRIGLK